MSCYLSVRGHRTGLPGLPLQPCSCRFPILAALQWRHKRHRLPFPAVQVARALRGCSLPLVLLSSGQPSTLRFLPYVKTKSTEAGVCTWTCHTSKGPAPLSAIRLAPRQGGHQVSFQFEAWGDLGDHKVQRWLLPVPNIPHGCGRQAERKSQFSLSSSYWYRCEKQIPPHRRWI